MSSVGRVSQAVPRTAVVRILRAAALPAAPGVWALEAEAEAENSEACCTSCVSFHLMSHGISAPQELAHSIFTMQYYGACSAEGK